ncbi:hypothetical protein PSECIP111854_03965 [Pseudoalteromonas sp. CIP111854]|uniref:Uncharacterized protein n=2 Tax=Pseudoalteromonas holothuriae TaxID=2963714 RepID=A0A9W4W3G6_9GAMM|nr:hypothetical protein PSECIP111854_03965 [Pseudoalteromonas sp. CIP111854]
MTGIKILASSGQNGSTNSNPPGPANGGKNAKQGTSSKHSCSGQSAAGDGSTGIAGQPGGAAGDGQFFTLATFDLGEVHGKVPFTFMPANGGNGGNGQPGGPGGNGGASADKDDNCSYLPEGAGGKGGDGGAGSNGGNGGDVPDILITYTGNTIPDIVYPSESDLTDLLTGGTGGSGGSGGIGGTGNPAGGSGETGAAGSAGKTGKYKSYSIKQKLPLN